MKNRVRYLTEKVKTLEDRSDKSELLNSIGFEDLKLLIRKFSPCQTVADFIEVQLAEGQKKPRGRRFTEKFKNECLKMYFTGPKLYKNYLVKTFCLPSARVLLKHIQSVKVRPGLNDNILYLIKTKTANLSNLDRMCILCFDEMSIKANLFYNRGTDEVIGFEDFGNDQRAFKPALNATVLMIRGLYTNWKQPVAYYLHNSSCPANTLKTILHNCINALHACNLDVCCVISDLGPNNWKLSNILNITPECPFFYVDEKQILYMFDTPHLIKLARNNLMKNIFLFNDQVTSWKHLERFYLHDKQYDTRAAPKLTDSHLYPSAFEKMKVKYAVQVLSATVASGMNLYIRFGVLPAAAVGTSEFIERFDKLFDILNSSSVISSKIFSRAFKNDEYQKAFLNECKEFFSNVTITDINGRDVTTSIKCIKGWHVTIRAFEMLWEKVSAVGFQYVHSRRLNQDALENLFGKIRQQNGNCINPTPIQFQRTFRKLLCLDVLNSGSENCQGDTDKILLNFADFSSSSAVDVVNVTNVHTVSITDTDYQNLDILEKNFIRYVCGYVIKKSLKVHECDVCVKYSKSITDLDDSTFYCHLRAYDTSGDTFGSLHMPHENFVHLISYIDASFRNCFERISIEPHIVQTFVNSLGVVRFNHPCKNFPIKFVLMLYTRVRLYYLLKFINRNFKNQSTVGQRRNKNKYIIWKHE